MYSGRLASISLKSILGLWSALVRVAISVVSLLAIRSRVNLEIVTSVIGVLWISIGTVSSRVSISFLALRSAILILVWLSIIAIASIILALGLLSVEAISPLLVYLMVILGVVTLVRIISVSAITSLVIGYQWLWHVLL